MGEHLNNPNMSTTAGWACLSLDEIIGMKDRRDSLLLLLLLLVTPAAAGVNPIISDQVDLADPSVLEHNGTLYLYPTSNQANFEV